MRRVFLNKRGKINFKLFAFFFLLMFLVSCEGKRKVEKVNLRGITIETPEIKRYERALFALATDSISDELKRISSEYKVFLDADLDDTLNLLKMLDFINDPIFIGLYQDVERQFPELNSQQKELMEGFRHLKYYYPDFCTPVIYTYVSGLDYEHPVKLLDNSLIIAIDMYLGADYKIYTAAGLPKFRTHWMQSENIVADCFREYAYYFLDSKSPRTILDYMIYYGKQLYFLDAVMPSLHDSIKLRYTDDQLLWADENHGNIWTFFIENQLLYSSETALIKKLVTDAPFTAQFSKRSPGRILWFIGFQIVRSYMENNDIDLPELMKLSDSQQLLASSKYKPKQGKSGHFK